MNIEIGKKALITTMNWFYAPDGKQYRAVYGTVKSIKDDHTTLGIKTNRGSTNWYVEIGNMLIAGCQIFYAIACDEVNLEEVADFTTGEKGIVHYQRPSNIYNAD